MKTTIEISQFGQIVISDLAKCATVTMGETTFTLSPDEMDDLIRALQAHRRAARRTR